MQGTPLINGQRHSWASVRCNVLGHTLVGISEINYSDSVVIEDHYGQGQMPVDRGVGNYSATANWTVKAYEVQRIQGLLPPGAYLADIPPFDITIVFLAKGSDQQVTHILRNVQFPQNARNLGQGNTAIDVPMELKISHITW